MLDWIYVLDVIDNSYHNLEQKKVFETFLFIYFI